MTEHRLRPLLPTDEPFVLRAIALAADWRPGTDPRPTDEIASSPELAHYVPDWTGADRGLLAEAGGAPVGACWWRYFPANDPGYGFVAPDVPEVTLAVEPSHRSAGVGTALLTGLIALARRRDLRAVSLSVEPDNRAAALYRRLGFTPVAKNGGADTLLLTLG